jgi:hypothetical protein
VKNKRISFFGMLLAALLLLMTRLRAEHPTRAFGHGRDGRRTDADRHGANPAPPTETPTPTATNTPTPTPTLVTSIGRITSGGCQTINRPAGRKSQLAQPPAGDSQGCQITQPWAGRMPAFVRGIIVWEYYIGEGSNRFARAVLRTGRRKKLVLSVRQIS